MRVNATSQRSAQADRTHDRPGAGRGPILTAFGKRALSYGGIPPYAFHNNDNGMCAHLGTRKEPPVCCSVNTARKSKTTGVAVISRFYDHPTGCLRDSTLEPGGVSGSGGSRSFPDLRKTIEQQLRAVHVIAALRSTQVLIVKAVHVMRRIEDYERIVHVFCRF
jgi:hypothetical protein